MKRRSLISDTLTRIRRIDETFVLSLARVNAKSRQLSGDELERFTRTALVKRRCRRWRSLPCTFSEPSW